MGAPAVDFGEGRMVAENAAGAMARGFAGDRGVPGICWEL
jgi:hypothetical protein